MAIKGKEKDTERTIERQKEMRGKEKHNLYAYTPAYNTSSTSFQGEKHQS